MVPPTQRKPMTQQQREAEEKRLREEQAALQKQLDEMRERNKFRPEHPFALFDCKCYRCDYCSCGDRIISSALFLENVHDVAVAVAKVMTICGIHACKAQSAMEVVVDAIMNYEDIRHRIDTVPKKRVRKEEIMHALGQKCMMSLVEATLAYGIIKRAFKAFYHGTTCNIKTITPDRQVLHNEECFWLHAAVRTAQIFASYEGLFTSHRYNYERQIRCVYSELLERLKSRTYMKRVHEPCTCVNCPKQKVSKSVAPPPSVRRSDGNIPLEQKDVPVMSKSCQDQVLPVKKCGIDCRDRKEYEIMDEEEAQAKAEEEERRQLCSSEEKIDEAESNISIHLPRCYKCSCPRLMCDCDIDKATGFVTAECSQGPYVCHWVRVDDEPSEPDPCVPFPEDHVCPIDCDAESIDCEECVCEDTCDCCEDEEELWDDMLSLEAEVIEQEEYIEEEEIKEYCGCPRATYPC